MQTKNHERRSTRSLARAITLIAVLIITTVPAFSVGSLFVRPLRSSSNFQDISIKSYVVNVDIQDHVATTHVDQTFYNEMNQQVEATLVFPLPAGAVITEMFYWFNGVRYKASVRERKEAQAAYDSKIRRYLDPALLQEIGDNVFKLNIAPVNALSDVRVEITYTEILQFSLGRSTYMHLLRSTGVSPKPLQHMSMQIRAHGGAPFESVVSPTHPFNASHTVDQVAPNDYRITLGDENYVSTKNYELRLRTKRNGVEMGTLTYVPVESDSFGTRPFFLTWVIPPDSGTSPLPRSVVFVADVSSSMEGRRMDQLREALHLFLDQLNEGDRFNIITFSTGVIGFRSEFAAVNPGTIAEAHTFVDTRTALGLTNISEALHQSLAMDFMTETANAVVFLTDGQPSWGQTNSAFILDSVAVWNTHNVRIYPITVGEESSVSLMRTIANRTGGFLTEVTEDDSIAVSVEDHLRRISMPNLVDLELTYGSLRTFDVSPQDLPNVAVGGRVVQTGRYEVGGWYPVTLNGTLISVPFSLTRDVLFSDPATNNRAVARLWAQAKIQSLLDEIERNGEQKELVDAVIDLSIRFGILTKYTALYADPDDPGSATSVPGADRPIETIKVMVAPHPVTSSSDVTVELSSDLLGQHVAVELYNSMGQRIRVLFDGIPQGSIMHLGRLLEDNAQLPPGAYYLIVKSDTKQVVEPIIVTGGVR